MHDIRSIELGTVANDTETSNNFAIRVAAKAENAALLLELQAALRLILVIDKNGRSRVVQRFCFKPDQCDPIITALKAAYEATLKAAPLPRNR